MGRPTSYTPELGAAVCSLIESSEHGARKALKQVPELPAYSTAMRWAAQNASFAADLARARQSRLKAWAEDIIDISDDDTLDPADKRIRVDTRKWLLSKELNLVYGDKLDVTSGGEALAAPAHSIDARIQSIVMQAQARRAVTVEDVPEEALKLLE